MSFPSEGTNLQISSGILLHRFSNKQLEVFLVHPGGPFWRGKDIAAWSIPKGLVLPDEDPLLAARREFREETGFDLEGSFAELGEFRLPGGKRLKVWTLEGDCDPSKLVSNTFDLVWPPRSGKIRAFPEVDKAGWFSSNAALINIHRGQRIVLERFFGGDGANRKDRSSHFP
jgi:predicted NUDIX family NTP pyrophosphohydrolase